MKLKLAHVANGDISGGYWQPPIDKKPITLELPTLRACSAALDTWVTRNGLGSGNMARECGYVFDGGKQIAEISYNGRAWEPGMVGKKPIELT